VKGGDLTLQLLVEEDPKAYGSTNLWSFDLLEVGAGSELSGFEQ
jgi:hypothetical protein